MSVGAPADWSVTCVDTEGELLALREPWNALLAHADGRSIFLTWEWLTTWWRHRSRNERLMVLLAYDGAGRLVGIAPWMRLQRRFGPLPLRCVAFLGTGFAYPGHLDVIAAAGDKQRATQAFLDYLARYADTWDVLDLECLSDRSLLMPQLAKVRGLWLDRAAQIAPFIVLPDTWETYEQDELSSSHRQQIRTRRRRLLRDYEDVAYERVENFEQLTAGLDALACLSRRRFDEKGMVSSFSRSAFEDFLREITGIFLECGWLRFNVLRVEGQPIAAHCSFRYDQTVYGYQTSFATDWGKYRPGQLIQAHVIQAAIEEGAEEFDLLQGANEYKFFWTSASRVERHRVLSRTSRGHGWSAALWLVERAKLKAREVLPAGAQQRIEKWLRRASRLTAN